MTGTGVVSSRARSVHWRAVRVVTLILVGAFVAWASYPNNNQEFASANYWPLWFAYSIFAVAIGELWESIGAVAFSAVATVLVLGGPFYAFGFPYRDGSPYRTSLLAWLLFVFCSIALTTLVHRRRRAIPAHDSAAPLVPGDLEDPVLIIRGHAQILQQGTGVVFDTRQTRSHGQDATAELAGLPGGARGAGAVE